ncbi:hypothetical protein [Bradyrhizobium sp. 150]|uniref:hypothetical protein n=1 Tax=Bradyrhizobium sp. 150 TaxID=2782625 RepID=UPI001FF908B7|nr:hypothetical protein [Bradyrhizobium sp. 150]MCK1673189.1 hypothetical protein [Bradyrhizobium sp. 150]
MIDAMTTVTDPMFVFDRKRIVDFGIENKIPNAHEYREWVQSGGLLAFGPTIDGIWRRGAYFVEKILNGAKPSDLPVEGPVNRRSNLTPYRRPILTPSSGGFWR